MFCFYYCFTVTVKVSKKCSLDKEDLSLKMSWFRDTDCPFPSQYNTFSFLIEILHGLDLKFLAKNVKKIIVLTGKDS